SEIANKMKAIYDVSIDRRTVYRNIAQLIEFGYDISTPEEDHNAYYLREREFEPSELHMLADAILTADFVPEADGKRLIGKLQQLGSDYQTKPLNRLSNVKTNHKAPNKEIFYTIEELDAAIHEKKKVEFEYVSYDLNLKLKPRREKKYVANPYALYWGNGQYYLISSMDSHEGICHFRLDRIKKIAITDIPVKPAPDNLDLYQYARNALFMYGGDTQTFTIQCSKTILNDVVDKFGDQIIITDSDETTFTTIVRATTQGMKIWTMNYMTACKVIAPEWLVEHVSNEIRKGMANYGI
ncbi:MAG: WYL domain-containing protein, partial [Eubacteriales bacterium]|nr:WYL domain-containing protein [Eubacteriales bacterium]